MLNTVRKKGPMILIGGHQLLPKGSVHNTQAFIGHFIGGPRNRNLCIFSSCGWGILFVYSCAYCLLPPDVFFAPCPWYLQYVWLVTKSTKIADLSIYLVIGWVGCSWHLGGTVKGNPAIAEEGEVPERRLGHSCEKMCPLKTTSCELIPSCISNWENALMDAWKGQEYCWLQSN